MGSTVYYSMVFVSAGRSEAMLFTFQIRGSRRAWDALCRAVVCRSSARGAVCCRTLVLQHNLGQGAISILIWPGSKLHFASHTIPRDTSVRPGDVSGLSPFRGIRQWDQGMSLTIPRDPSVRPGDVSHHSEGSVSGTRGCLSPFRGICQWDQRTSLTILGDLSVGPGDVSHHFEGSVSGTRGRL